MTLPLHERIRGDFEARILSGDLAPGERLPTEQELMRVHDCSRMTVSKALSALAAAGLVERRKRGGTLVARPRAHSMILDIPDLAEQCREQGQVHGYDVLDRRMTAFSPAMPDCQGGMLEIDGVHLADGVPLALETRLVSIAAVPAIVDVDFGAVSPGSWLLRHIPWTQAESRISAVAASREEAGRLGLDAGAPCLRLVRRTWRGGEAITFVRQTFPGDRYEMLARFGPDRIGG